MSAIPQHQPLPVYDWSDRARSNVFAWIVGQSAAVKRQRHVAETCLRMAQRQRNQTPDYWLVREPSE
jgi:pyridoxine/pyridoxamine 5'-phosphate oxidase